MCLKGTKFSYKMNQSGDLKCKIVTLLSSTVCVVYLKVVQRIDLKSSQNTGQLCEMMDVLINLTVIIHYIYKIKSSRYTA